MSRPGAEEALLRRHRHCDLVIESGDFARGAERGPTTLTERRRRSRTISILETTPPLPRAEGRAELGLHSDPPIALITPGVGSPR